MSRLRATMAAAAAALVALSTPALAGVRIADTVDAHGNLVGETTLVDPLATPTDAIQLQAVRPDPVPGEHKVAVIPIQFSGQPAAPFTTDDLNQVVFTGTDSVDAYFRESSYQRLWLTGTVFPTVTVSADTTTCQQDAYGKAAITALQGLGESITGDGTDGYQHYMYVFTNVAACPYAGLAMVPGRDIWINGYVDRSVMAHELGHNLGLGHANTIRCLDSGGTPVVLSNACSEKEYADPYEVMGMGGMQLSAMSRQLIGVLTPEQHVTVTNNATLTLESASIDGAGIKSIEIPRPGTKDVWFLEARSAAGYDVFGVGDTAPQGVLIRKRTEDAMWMTDSQLVDAHPSTTSIRDSAFAVGQTLSDPTGGITITVTARTATTATVKITFGIVGSTGSTVMITTNPAIAAPWASKISMYRRTDGRLYISVRRVTSAGPTCTFKIRATVLNSGTCTKLVAVRGWTTTRIIRAGEDVTVNFFVPGRANPVAKRVKAPLIAGRHRIYRLV